MEELEIYLSRIQSSSCSRIVLSKPARGYQEYQKIVFTAKRNGYQIEKFTEKQAFHENITAEELCSHLLLFLPDCFKQVNAFSSESEQMIMISKKGKVTWKQKQGSQNLKEEQTHNRKKEYLLKEGEKIEPLTDMGIFTAEGKVVHAMYDKYRQINRFLEIIDDAVRQESKETLHIIDFGCGKSYLTFVLYYYFTEIKKKKVDIVGLDLKKDVIEKCNLAAQKYGYSGLRFEVGDIAGYQTKKEVDMVVTLHACDTATDFALFHAVQWNARMIFSVPCCQHELNSQLESEKFSLMTRYGIIKERFAALTTDAIRANLLEYCGYRTQLLEFVDLSHTPKNILIRAQKKNTNSAKHRTLMLNEVQQMMQEYHLKPMLYGLLMSEDLIEEADC